MNLNFKTHRKTMVVVVTIISLVFAINVVSALAVSAPYMENRELYILPGQTIDLEFILQEGKAIENTRIVVSINKGEEIIELTAKENIYIIPVGEKTAVNTKVTIPPNAKINDSYDIELAFTTQPDPESGTFAFGTSIGQKFKVIIGEKPETSPVTGEAVEKTNQGTGAIIYVVAIIIILIGITVFFLIKKSKSQESANKNIIKSKKP